MIKDLVHNLPREPLFNGLLLEEGAMKLIIAVIQPSKMYEVQEALSGAGVKGLTVTDALGFGHQKGHTEHYRGAEYEVKFLPKKKIEVAVADEVCDKVVETIMTAARTGNIGDGKIFIHEIQSAVRIRTGERDADVL